MGQPLYPALSVVDGLSREGEAERLFSVNLKQNGNP